MKNLILFLLKSTTFFEFLLLEIIAFVLILSNNSYQSNVILSSCNNVVGSVYQLENNVVDFFSLRKRNEQLANENSLLQTQIVFLSEQLKQAENEKDTTLRETETFQFISAKIIRNAVNGLNNYLLIDKGSNQGINPEMGVVNEKGVVGIVKTVSSNFAIVIPVLNTRLQLSARMKNGQAFGSLVWDGEDTRFAKLEEIPRHIHVEKGDTIVTSGYSTAFPKGFPIGYVYEAFLASDAAHYDIKVRLSCDFLSTDYVKVIRYKNRQEFQTIEKELKEADR